MKQMSFINNEMENSLIKGVKKVSDKVYRFVAIYDRVWVDVEKYEPLPIIEGLETYITLVKKDGMDYWEVFEGITGAVVGYAFGGEKEKKQEAIKRATEQLTNLQTKGILVDVITKIANHITNGISPRYEGNLIDNNNRSSALKELEVGDSIAIINLRGGLSYYTATIESYKHVNRGGKEGIEYKFISDRSGYYFFKTFGSDGCNPSFMYEPEFVELYEKAIVEKATEEVAMKNIEAPIRVTNERVWQEDLRKHLVFADKTDCYNTFEANMIQAAELLTDTEIPEEVTEYNNLLSLNGYLLTEARIIDNKVNYFYYSLLLPNLKRIIRVRLSNETGKLYYQISITNNQSDSSAFNVRWLLTGGYVETLKVVLEEVSSIVAENEVSIEEVDKADTQITETVVEIEHITPIIETVEVSTEILEIIKENLAKPLTDLKRYNHWDDSVRKSAIKNADKEVPKALTDTDKFLLSNGFVRSYNEKLTTEKYQVVYFMSLSESRKFFRLTCSGAMINNELKDRFEIRIMGPKFEGESLIHEGGIETLGEIVKQCLVAVRKNFSNNIQIEETVNVTEVFEIENITIADMIKTGQIWDATPMDIEDDWLKRYDAVGSLLESTRDEINNIKEQLKDQKGEEKKITQQKINTLKDEIIKAETKLNVEQEEINLKIRNIIVERVKAKLGEILEEDVSTLVGEIMMALSDDRSYRETYYNTTLEKILNDLITQYLEDKTKDVKENKVYTLEEIAQLRLNLSMTQVQVEDITTITNEEFVLKRNGIWAMKNKAEVIERNKDTPDYSYTSIFDPLYEILTKEERERTFEYIETLTDEQIKYFMTKWLSGEYALEAYKEGGKGKVEEIIKGRCSSFSGGTLTADYQFFIGHVQCQNKLITANIKHKIYADTSVNYVKVTMNIKEATERLVKYYKETLNETETKTNIDTAKVEIKEIIEVKEIMQVSFVELTANELEKICSKTKNKKQKSNYIEGQMMLAI